jgi:hypothetical protein
MADAALARSVMFDVTAAARAVEAVYRQLLEEKT